MKKTLITVIAFTTLSALGSFGQSLNLSSFGSSAEAFSSSGWSYNATTSVLSGSNTIDSLAYNASGGPWNLTTVGSIPSLSLQLVLASPASGSTGSFNITLEDGDGIQYVSPSWTWSEFASSVSVDKSYSSGTIPDGFDPSNVVSWNINSQSASGSVNVELSQLNVVPEPSTYALMALGGLVMFFMIRRRKAKA